MLLTEHNLEFLSLKGGCTGSFDSIHVNLSHYWKSHVTAHIVSACGSLTENVSAFFDSTLKPRMESCSTLMKDTTDCVLPRLAPVLKTNFHQCVIPYTCSQSNFDGSVPCSLVVTCWERADLLALLCVVCSCRLVTFPYGVPSQVWYLIVSNPDFVFLSAFLIYQRTVSFAFDDDTVPIQSTEGIEACQFFMRNGCKLEGSI